MSQLFFVILCYFAFPGCTTSLPAPSPTSNPMGQSHDQIPCYMSCKHKYARCIKREELVADRFIFRNYRLICRQARVICELKQCDRYLSCLGICSRSIDNCMGPEGPKDTQQDDVICFQSNYLCKQHCRIEEITSPYRVVDHT